MKKSGSIFTLSLFIILIFSRLSIRNINSFWTDEIEQINHLTTMHHLVREYLPTIPGGSPGHYILTLPLNILFPNNKFILFVSFITRVGFVLDPVLSAQAMEVRPYSMLPLLWFTVVFISLKLFILDTKFPRSVFRIIILGIATVAIFIWHFYGMIMFVSICLFIVAKNKININKFLNKKSFIGIVLISIILSLPFWQYFSQGSHKFNFDTFEFLTMHIFNVYFYNQGSVKGLLLQNILYFLLLTAAVLVSMKTLLDNLKAKSQERVYCILSIKILLYLVIFPIAVILSLDILNRYWFLYRQISWVAIPFYIAVGILINSLLIKKSILKKRNND